MVGIKRRLDYNCAMKVLREFGLGILYAILLPILLAIAAVVAVYGIFNFLIEFVIMVVNFFKGEKLFPLYKEDRQAMERVFSTLSQNLKKLPDTKEGGGKQG